MAIAPIDLQTLYTQLDKIGKSQGNQAQLLQVQTNIQDVEKAKQQLEEKKKIASTKMTDQEDTQKIKDNQHKNQQNFQSQKEENPEKEDEIQKEENKVFFKDPNLGQHIDVLG